MKGQLTKHGERGKWERPRVQFDGNPDTLIVAGGTSPEITSRKSSTSTYQPSSGQNPYGPQNASADTKRRLIRDELKGCSLTPNTTLIDTFFPNESTHKDIFDALGHHYGSRERRCARDSGGRRHVLLKESWKLMPDPPVGAEDSIAERDITKVIVPIINDIIMKLGLGDKRVAIDHQNREIQTRDGGSLRPDIFVWGKGSPSFPPTEVSTPVPSGSGSTRDLHLDWQWCVFPVEVKTDRYRGGPENMDALYQLGTYVREVFAAQSHRRFVPSLIVTESTAEFLLWDRAGVVASQRLDYHDKALKFCHILASLLEWDDSRLGFDPNITYHNDEFHVRTQEPFEYVIDATFVRSYSIRGRGSTCWRARRVGENNWYLIQDSWVATGMGGEHSILCKMEELRVDQGLAGIAPFVHMEEVKYLDSATNVVHHDTVVTNRGGAGPAIIDLIHTRSISRCHSWECTPLETFTNPKDLVCAIHDVIKGLACLYEKAGVVHRDIVLWNIFLQPTAPEGSRGILIDFSCAAFSTSGVTIPRPDATPGSHFFRCCDSLEGREINSHSHDLESIYWVLIFLIGGHAGPDVAASRLHGDQIPREMTSLLTEREDSAALAKSSHFAHRRLQLPVQSWFGKPVERLARDLHDFFHNNSVPKDPRSDYNRILECFRRATRSLDGYPEGVTSMQSLGGSLSSTPDGARFPAKRGRSNEVTPNVSPAKKKIQLGIAWKIEGRKPVILWNHSAHVTSSE